MTYDVLMSIMLEALFSKYPEKQTELEALQVNSQSEEFRSEELSTTTKCTDTIQAALQVYHKEKTALSQSFDYWNTYISDLFPIVRILTNSLCCGD